MEKLLLIFSIYQIDMNLKKKTKKAQQSHSPLQVIFTFNSCEWINRENNLCWCDRHEKYTGKHVCVYVCIWLYIIWPYFVCVLKTWACVSVAEPLMKKERKYMCGASWHARDCVRAKYRFMHLRKHSHMHVFVFGPYNIYKTLTHYIAV